MVIFFLKIHPINEINRRVDFDSQKGLGKGHNSMYALWLTVTINCQPFKNILPKFLVLQMSKISGTAIPKCFI